MTAGCWLHLTTLSSPSAEQAACSTRRHVAACHISQALQVLMRQKGLGLSWKPSWRRPEGQTNWQQHARPCPPQSLKQPYKSGGFGRQQGRLRCREG